MNGFSENSSDYIITDYSKGLDDDDENNEGKEDDNPEYYSDAVEKLSSSLYTFELGKNLILS